jgi:hypothetical protein
MGVLGEMFPGKKLSDSGDEDTEGKIHRPRFDIDLDSGVVRMPAPAGPSAPRRDDADKADVADEDSAS